MTNRRRGALVAVVAEVRPAVRVGAVVPVQPSLAPVATVIARRRLGASPCLILRLCVGFHHRGGFGRRVGFGRLGGFHRNRDYGPHAEFLVLVFHLTDPRDMEPR